MMINLNNLLINNEFILLEIILQNNKYEIEVVNIEDNFNYENKILVYCTKDMIFTHVFNFCICNCIHLLKGIVNSRSFKTNTKLMNYMLKMSIQHDKILIINHLLTERLFSSYILRECLYLAERYGNNNIIKKIKQKLIEAITRRCLIKHNSMKSKLNIKTMENILLKKPILRQHIYNIKSMYSSGYLPNLVFIRMLRSNIKQGDLYSMESLMIFLNIYDKYI